MGDYGDGAQYGTEAVDRLPFSTPEKSQRYQTGNYTGAVGLNWYRTDPSLQFTMAYYLRPDELAFAEPHLTRIGELMGGPVGRRARPQPAAAGALRPVGARRQPSRHAVVVHRVQACGAGRATGS